MRKTLYAACFALLSMAGAASAEPAVKPKIIVMPFQDVPDGTLRAVKGQDYLILGLPIALAETLEEESSFETLNGPLVFTDEQARLAPPVGARLDLAEANRLALSKGATHFVSGRFAGYEWAEWKLTVEVYAVGPDGPSLVGSGSASDRLTLAERAVLKGRYGQSKAYAKNVVSAETLQRLLGAATVRAFMRSGLTLSGRARASLMTPSTNDSWAFIQLARAYGRFYRPEIEDHHRTALELAETAVKVDPAYAEAQRFYAYLLSKAGKASKAGLHYEEAIKARPDDIRVLGELGRLQLEAGNYEAARTSLSKAVRARPDHALTRFRLAQADLKLGRREAAVAGFEEAERLDPKSLDTRRALASLYAEDRRYDDAAGEYKALAAAEPSDIENVFRLAASLRAAGHPEDAAAAYREAEPRFAGEARLPKFRGDLLRQMKKTSEAYAAYEQAQRLAPNDARMKELLAVVANEEPFQPTDHLGGPELVAAVGSATRVVEELEAARRRIQLALNDALVDFAINGKEACQDGRALSSIKSYRDEEPGFVTKGRTLSETDAKLRAALAGGEGAALTSDERRDAEAALAALNRFVADYREIGAQYQSAVLALLQKRGCVDKVDAAQPADPAALEKRNRDRRVTLPKPKEEPSLIPIAPSVPADSARSVRFTVNNRSGTQEYVLTLDGTEIGSVPPKETRSFSALAGPHRLCVLPKGLACGEPGTLREFTLDDGLTITVLR